MARNASRTLIKIKKARHMLYSTTTADRLQEIEQERIQTQSDPAYMEWVKTLNVSSSYIDKTFIINAREAMREWDCSRFILKVEKE